MTDRGHVGRVKSRLGKRGSTSFIQPTSFSPMHSSRFRRDLAEGLSTSIIMAPNNEVKHAGVSKCLFGSTLSQEKDYSSIDKTPMLTHDSLGDELRVICKPRRSILGKNIEHASLLNLTSVSRDKTILEDAISEENDKNFNNCTLDRLVSSKEKEKNVFGLSHKTNSDTITPFGTFTDDDPPFSALSREVITKGAWSVFKTKPYHLEPPQSKKQSQPQNTPPKSGHSSTAPQLSFTMNRFLQYQSGVLESPKAPPPRTCFSRHVFKMPPEPRLPSPPKFDGDVTANQATEKNTCPENQFDQSVVSSDDSLKSFTENEITIMGVDKTMSIADSCQKSAEHSSSQKRPECQTAAFDQTVLDMNQTQDCTLMPEGTANLDATVSSTDDGVLSLDAALTQLLDQKKRCDHALEVYLKEKATFDVQLEALVKAAISKRPMRSKRKSLGVVSVKLRKSSGVPASPAVSKRGKLDPFSRGPVSGSAAKAYSQLRASYSNFLKTPLRKNILDKSPRQNCYTPRSLSTCVGNQMKDIFDS